jgi:acyl-coenzyme A thioesterase PaaI-like protein
VPLKRNKGAKSRQCEAKDAAMTVFPPYGQLLQLRTETREDGSLLFVMPFHDDVVGRPGYLHGGAIAGLLEFAAYGELARAVEGRNVTPKPISVTIDYLLGGKNRDTFAAATIERLGARIANVEAFAWQKDRSTPIASCRINFLLATT